MMRRRMFIEPPEYKAWALGTRPIIVSWPTEIALFSTQ
jgi:hypothetical protein